MQTLSYGYKLPQSGDKGAPLWTALEANITRLNGHTHNGTDSARLPVQNFDTTSQAISSASWSNAGLPTGHYKQTVTIPAGFTFDAFLISFRDEDGDIIYPEVVRLSNTTYEIYTIDNTQDYTAVYGV